MIAYVIKLIKLINRYKCRTRFFEEQIEQFYLIINRKPPGFKTFENILKMRDSKYITNFVELQLKNNSSDSWPIHKTKF